MDVIFFVAVFSAFFCDEKKLDHGCSCECGWLESVLFCFGIFIAPPISRNTIG